MDGFHKVGAFGVLIAILFASLSPFARAADPSTPVSEDAGTVDSSWLGGGDHHFIRFGSDAAFGVLWGTNATPNNIYLVAIKARYLGVADVENAAVTAPERPEKSRHHRRHALRRPTVLARRIGPLKIRPLGTIDPAPLLRHSGVVYSSRTRGIKRGTNDRSDRSNLVKTSTLEYARRSVATFGSSTPIEHA